MLTLLRLVAGKAGWLVMSFLIIVAALALWNRLPGAARGWEQQAQNTQGVAETLAQRRAQFAQQAREQIALSEQQIGQIRGAGAGQLAQARRTVAEQRTAAQARVLDEAGLARAVLRGDSGAVIASQRAQWVTLPLLDRAADLIEIRSDNLTIASLDEAQATHRQAVARYNADVQARDELRARAARQTRNPVCVEAAWLPGCELARAVEERTADLQRRRAALEAEATLLRARQDMQAQLVRRSEQVADADVILNRAVTAYIAQTERVRADAAGYAVNQGRSALRDYGLTAAQIVLAAVLLPILLKLFAFYVIAPLAATARPIQLRPAGPSLNAAASGMSVDVPLGPDTEVLLRSGLQSSAADVRGGDLYLLDWSMPFTCLAAGLVNLQRLRSARPDHVVVTGTDEAYRVSAIAVPAGGAAVLQPRVLLGIAKPRGANLVITRPWQLARLTAWITLQLRFVVFHGPCTLIVQGRGGVVVEDAGKGRMISKRLTLGFDAGLAYGAARSASFLPYLKGQASLFNDRFEGDGRYLFEQRPATIGKGGIWGRGLKGIGDAALKVVGI